MIEQGVIDKANELRLRVLSQASRQEGYRKRLGKAREMFPMVASGQLGEFKAFDQMGRLLIPAKDGKSEYYTRIWSGGCTCSCPDFQHSTHGSPCKHVMVLYGLVLNYNESLERFQEFSSVIEEE